MLGLKTITQVRSQNVLLTRGVPYSQDIAIRYSHIRDEQLEHVPPSCLCATDVDGCLVNVSLLLGVHEPFMVCF